MDAHYFGNPYANTILIQMVDDHDLALIEQEVTHISALTNGADFLLAAFKVDAWNKDLSPWPAPAVFGKEDFGGYSLAGLFALWAAYQTDLFAGVAAASPSVWFPDFREYMKSHEPYTQAVYLSLGDREEKTKRGCQSIYARISHLH